VTHLGSARLYAARAILAEIERAYVKGSLSTSTTVTFPSSSDQPAV
jgi:hypothetical protein